MTNSTFVQNKATIILHGHARRTTISRQIRSLEKQDGSYSWFSRDVRKTKIKLRLKILSSYLYRVKDIFKRISAGLFSARQTALLLKQNTVFSQCLTSALFLGNMLRARKYRFALCFRVLSNQYVERSAYANVFKFNRENKRFERAKVNSRCFHWFPVAMLESL